MFFCVQSLAAAIFPSRGLTLCVALFAYQLQPLGDESVRTAQSMESTAICMRTMTQILRRAEGVLVQKEPLPESEKRVFRRGS